MREPDEIKVQNAGRREEREKKTKEPFMSRDRICKLEISAGEWMTEQLAHTLKVCMSTHE